MDGKRHRDDGALLLCAPYVFAQSRLHWKGRAEEKEKKKIEISSEGFSCAARKEPEKKRARRDSIISLKSPEPNFRYVAGHVSSISNASDEKRSPGHLVAILYNTRVIRRVKVCGPSAIPFFPPRPSVPVCSIIYGIFRMRSRRGFKKVHATRKTANVPRRRFQSERIYLFIYAAFMRYILS